MLLGFHNRVVTMCLALYVLVTCSLLRTAKEVFVQLKWICIYHEYDGGGEVAVFLGELTA